jgi:AcrR family transcriptional regulator
MEKKLSRRERDEERHREEILEAAKAAFVDHGFEGATMQEIAARAEFSLASVYKGFESKEQLFQELIVGHVKRYLVELDNAVAGVASPMERIRTSIRVSISYLEEEKELSHLLLRDLRGLWSPDNATQAANGAYRAVFAYYEGLFREAQAVHELCDVDPSEAALCLLGTLHLRLVYSLFIEPQRPLDAEMMLRVVLGPIAASCAYRKLHPPRSPTDSDTRHRA